MANSAADRFDFLLSLMARLRGDGGCPWDRQRPRSALDGVPDTLPALLRAQRLQVKAGRVGFDWAEWREAWAKVREEMRELEATLDAGDAGRVSDELGDVLFSLVNVARLRGIDAEDCLRQAAAKFTPRFRGGEAERMTASRA